MLEATPHHPLSPGYQLRLHGQPLSTLPSASDMRVEFQLGGRAYQLQRGERPRSALHLLQELGRSLLNREEFRLLQGTEVLATARGTRLLGQDFAVEVAGQRLQLAWRPEAQAFLLRDAQAPVGRVAPRTGLLRRGLVADLPGTLPLPVQVFLCWLVLCRREIVGGADGGAGDE